MTQLTATRSSFRQPDLSSPLLSSRPHVRPSYPLAVDGPRENIALRLCPPRFSPIFLISVESNTPRLREFREKSGEKNKMSPPPICPPWKIIFDFLGRELG